LAALLLASCSTTSNVMEMSNDTYMINARASRGGTAVAYSAAHDDAQAFCHQRGQRAIVVSHDSQNVYSSMFGGGHAVFAGGTGATGSATIVFRCE